MIHYLLSADHLHIINWVSFTKLDLCVEKLISAITVIRLQPVIRSIGLKVLGLAHWVQLVKYVYVDSHNCTLWLQVWDKWTVILSLQGEDLYHFRGQGGGWGSRENKPLETSHNHAQYGQSNRRRQTSSLSKGPVLSNPGTEGPSSILPKNPVSSTQCSQPTGALMQFIDVQTGAFHEYPDARTRKKI